VGEGRHRICVRRARWTSEPRTVVRRAQPAGCLSLHGAIQHLNARDTSFVAISRAPVEKLQRHAKRLGWSFPWVSSGRNSFNYDLAVSFEPDAEGKATYNYERQVVPFKDLQGASVFAKGADGAIYHTYSTYGRGQDIWNTTYNVLDMTPKGRDEDGLPFTMAWVKLHDEYAA
jgi:predicted dithiol-disulfide oxidoreductase (DUF899 family)